MEFLKPSALVAAIALTSCVQLRPLDERADGSVDADAQVIGCDGPACTCTPAITGLGLSVVAHGARLTIDGGCFTPVATVTLSGVAQAFTLVGDAHLVVEVVDATTPVGLDRTLVLDSPNGASNSVTAAVVHLTIDEVDAESTTGNDRDEFVSVSTGIAASLDLSAYALAFFDGTNDATYSTTPGVALATTDSAGRFLAGNSRISPTVRFPNGTLAETSAAHAVVLVQGSVPGASTSIGSLGRPIIDGVVYSVAPMTADSGLLDPILPNAADRVQPDESAGAAAETQSLARCGLALRSGTVFGVAAPTPSAANACP